MSLIRKPSELQVQTTIKALLYGQPGIGKTTLALSAPNPVLLDFDGGVHRVNTQHQVPTLQVNDYAEFLEVLGNGELNEYRTLVIDTAGKMLDYMSNYLIKNDPKIGKRDGSLTLQGFGVRKYEFLRILKAISIMGKHLVFVAHEREEREGDQKIVRPEIGGSSANDLIKELDLVGYYYAVGGQRVVSFDPCEKFYGKNTCNLANEIKVAHILDASGMPTAPNTLLTEIFKTYQDNLQKRQQTASEYRALLELLDENMDGITDLESLNEARNRLASWEQIWDSKIQAGKKLQAKAATLNAKFNKDTGKYEPAA